MFVEPVRIRGPFNNLIVKYPRPITVQLCDPSRVTRVSQLDISRSYKKNSRSPVVYFLLSTYTLPVFDNVFRHMINDTDESVQVHSLEVEYKFTLRPSSTFIFHTDNFSSPLSLVKNVTPASIPTRSQFSNHVHLYVRSAKLEAHRQLCIQNSSLKWITVCFMKTIAIDAFDPHCDANAVLP